MSRGQLMVVAVVVVPFSWPAVGEICARRSADLIRLEADSFNSIQFNSVEAATSVQLFAV